MRLALALITALALAAPAAAAPTVYSSLPLQGDARAQSEDVVRGMKLAVEESTLTVKYVSLDDAVAATGSWEPGQVSANARKAVSDDDTIAYLGEFNSGASAVSIPIINEAGILQISPSNTYVGLTRGGPGAERGEPDKYYPTGVRTYGRVVPADHTQAEAVLAYARQRGRKRIAIVNDGEVYGHGIARMVEERAKAYGIEVVMNVRVHRRNRVSIARRIRGLRADAMVYGGITQNGAAALWRSVHARNRRIDLFGVDGVAESPFTRRVPRTARARTFITNPTLDPRFYPPAGQAFLTRFRERYGRDPRPYAIYGYEAMALALDAYVRGGRTRAGAVDAFFKTRDRASVLGTYSIDEFGDTTLADYGGYRVSRGGRLVFDRILLARP